MNNHYLSTVILADARTQRTVSRNLKQERQKILNEKAHQRRSFSIKICSDSLLDSSVRWNDVWDVSNVELENKEYIFFVEGEVLASTFNFLLSRSDMAKGKELTDNCELTTDNCHRNAMT